MKLKCYFRVKKAIFRKSECGLTWSERKMDLRSFLRTADLEHLYDDLNDHGMEINLLVQANENDLREIAPKISDRIKLRNAIVLYRKAQANSTPSSRNESPSLLEQSFDPPEDEHALEDPALPVVLLSSVAGNDREPPLFLETSFSERTEIPAQIGLPTVIASTSHSSVNKTLTSQSSVSKTLTSQSSVNKTLTETKVVLATNSLTEWADQEWEFIQELGPLDEKKPLKELLQSCTFGKKLLQKRGQPLTPKERKLLVQLIVEHQLHLLPSVRDTIRQETWTAWANEIASLFEGEHTEIYYVPYRVTERQALPASGLLQNRLITHRRHLLLGKGKRRRESTDSSSSSGSAKRVRPLPPNLTSAAGSEDNEEQSLTWLKASSSPFESVINKWKKTFTARIEILKASDVDDYFKTFPGLTLPTGHELLASDFERTYPTATVSFNENFPLIKKKLLELLVEKGSNLRAEPAVSELLDLATVGEEQGSVAALRCIPYLLKQIPPIPTRKEKTPKAKKWKPARSEVSQAFISYVSSPGDIQRCIEDRATLAQKSGICFAPFIIAVGPSWSTVQGYEVVISKDVRYHFSDIKTAVQTAFKIYFALDIEYSADAAPCWMFIQRAIYKIITQFDDIYNKSVTLRELVKDCERTIASK